jgi:antitoxin VapB
VALSLKNPETERLAKELARATGETVTRAVTIALREKLDREKASKPSSIYEKLVRLSEETAPLMNDGRTSKQLFDELYDEETGLPK